jgi:sulfoxide reductase catalytic subunit YedY
MLIRRFRPGDSAAIRPSEITSESVYLERRKLLQAALAAGVAGIGAGWTQRAHAVSDLKAERNAKYSLSDTPNSYEDITTYNNYYEFGLDKGAPAANSGRFKPAPWTVAVKGEAEKTGTFALEDILKGHAIEERVYRLRCVEAWSMIIPWDGVPLASVLKQFNPTSKAKYVAFKTAPPAIRAVRRLMRAGRAVRGGASCPAAMAIARSSATNSGPSRRPRQPRKLMN